MSIVCSGSNRARRVRTFSGKLARGWAGAVESSGMDKREMDSDAETARSGGSAAEKTKAGELMRYNKVSTSVLHKLSRGARRT